MVSRVDKGAVANWWWTIDRWFLAAFVGLMVLGVVLSFAASPAVAERIGLDSFHFVFRQIFYMVIALFVLVGVSFLNERWIRRLALVMLIGSLLLMVAVLHVGMEIKGSRRWLHIAGVSIQPSEYLKPAFVIICAWLFAEHSRRPEIPGNLFTMILLGLVMALLIAQPDIGQSLLFICTWAVMFFMAGMAWLWIVLLGVAGLGGIIFVYAKFPHVAGRIDRFLTGEGDTFQVDMGREAILRGGWLGQGPGEGTVKRMLPDSHTDYVFAVAAEEFGLVVCFILLIMFAFIVLRGLRAAMADHDAFSRYAVGGMVSLFGMQAAINMAVNLQLLPPKGMTLPFISYGGSSLVAMAISMGMVLALTRRRPLKRSQIGRNYFPAGAAPAH